MRIFLKKHLKRGGAKAYTLLEIMMSVSIMSIAFLAFTFSVSEGGRIAELANGKLTYTSEAHQFMNTILPDIREAKDIEIGLWSGGVFTPITNSSYRVAHAIQVFASTNVTDYVVYYLDPSDDTLKSYAYGAAEPDRLVGTVTNTTPFSKEDFQGNLLTNDTSNFVLGILLEVNDTVFGNPLSDGQYQFDNFRLNTKVTRRMVE